MMVIVKLDSNQKDVAATSVELTNDTNRKSVQMSAKTTNMAAMTSHTNQEQDTYRHSPEVCAK